MQRTKEPQESLLVLYIIMFNAVLTLLILANNLFWLTTNTANYLLLFTHWNWSLLLLLYITLTIHDCYYDSIRKIDLESNKFNSDTPKIKIVLLKTLVPISIFVTLLYWLLLSKEVWGPNSPLFRRICGSYMHSLNLILTLIQIKDHEFEIIDSLYSIMFTIIYTLLLVIANQFYGREFPLG